MYASNLNSFFVCSPAPRHSPQAPLQFAASGGAAAGADDAGPAALVYARGAWRLAPPPPAAGSGRTRRFYAVVTRTIEVRSG